MILPWVTLGRNVRLKNSCTIQHNHGFLETNCWRLIDERVIPGWSRVEVEQSFLLVRWAKTDVGSFVDNTRSSLRCRWETIVRSVWWHCGEKSKRHWSSDNFSDRLVNDVLELEPVVLVLAVFGMHGDFHFSSLHFLGLVFGRTQDAWNFGSLQCHFSRKFCLGSEENSADSAVLTKWIQYG